MFEIFIGITALAALLSFFNAKYLKLPETIGIMILSMVVSLFMAMLNFIHPPTFISICQIIDQIEFRTILFDFLLGVLLFAGAIHVDLNTLLQEKRAVILYSTMGVVLSTIIIGTSFYYLSLLINLSIDFIYCLVFGALISPTDPVAVLSILKKVGAPKHLEIRIVGESLFNDGVGIVVFLSLLSLATMMQEFEISHIVKEFSIEGGGGMLMGLLLGHLGRKLIQKIAREPVIAVHISLAIVLGGYSLSSLLNVSGALALVVAGLVIGHGLYSESTPELLKAYMTVFWKILDEIFNAVLFVLIGIEIIALKFEFDYVLLAIFSVVIVIVARFIVILITNVFLKKANKANKKERSILTWAGLRGGISIALALTLPESEVRDLILISTYIVVVFSIIVQGLTIGKLIVKPHN